ncbi:MAG: hypothetical protein PHV06_07580, partial [bacterium]|nr:hypothetical protein [bacterium]
QSSTFPVNLTKENLSNEDIIFWGSGFIRSKDAPSDLNFEFEGTNDEQIQWKHYGSGARYGGGWARTVVPGSLLNLPFDFNEFFDLSLIGSGEIICKGRYDVNYFIWDNESKMGAFNEYLGTIYPEPFRLFVNMEGQLLAADIDFNPDKWNLNWFRMANNEGVFTVWIEKLPGNYSVKDVKQETILFNGVLKPTDIKIVGAEGKERMEIKFSKREGISYIGHIESGDKKVINISGQFSDDKWFYGEKEIEITGKEEDNRYQKNKK